MRVLTWNVLHRVHAENFDAPFAARWPDERLRVEATVAFLRRALAEGVEVALLQEVGGDVLAALRAAFADRAVLHHEYPRVPRQKQPAPTVRDAKEHLVVLAPPGARVHRAHTFASDPGKGFLFAALPDGRVVGTTHVSFGERRDAQLAALAEALRSVSGPACVGGDFNVEREVVQAALGAGVEVPALPPGSLPTRPTEDGGKDIDHLVCQRVTATEVAVLDPGVVSDHRPVRARLR